MATRLHGLPDTARPTKANKPISARKLLELGHRLPRQTRGSPGSDGSGGRGRVPTLHPTPASQPSAAAAIAHWGTPRPQLGARLEGTAAWQREKLEPALIRLFF